MVITETRRDDSSWIVEGELTDRSALSDELADFCAQYPIYHVKKAQESLEVAGIQTEGKMIKFPVLTITLTVNLTAANLGLTLYVQKSWAVKCCRISFSKVVVLKGRESNLFSANS